MANGSLGDRMSAVNQSVPSPPSDDLSPTEAIPQWQDYVYDNLGKMESLIDIALWSGDAFASCPQITHHYYFSVISDLLGNVRNGCDALVKLKATTE